VANFLQALAAVLGGNLVYYLLMPHLPVEARHLPRKYDLGMLVDFWICLVIFGAIKTLFGRRRSEQGR